MMALVDQMPTCENPDDYWDAIDLETSNIEDVLERLRTHSKRAAMHMKNNRWESAQIHLDSVFELTSEIKTRIQNIRNRRDWMERIMEALREKSES